MYHRKAGYRVVVMVATSKTFDLLKTIGLNKYERNLWVALLSRGASTAGELADISNVPRSRCYDVLESLADRGFVMIRPGKPMKYLAIPPREALERVKKRIDQRTEETKKKIDRLTRSDAIKELEKLHKDNIRTVRPEELTGALKGRHAMYQQIETMLKRANKSVKLITTEPGLQELQQHHGNLLKKIASGGVKIKIIAPINKNTSETAKELSKHVEIRDTGNVEHVQKLLGRMFVVDGNEFVFGLTDDAKIHPTQDVSLWTQSPHATSNIFEPMFELVWKHSKPFK